MTTTHRQAWSGGRRRALTATGLRRTGFPGLRLPALAALVWLATCTTHAASTGSTTRSEKELAPFDVWVSRTCIFNLNEIDAAAAVKIFVNASGGDLPVPYRTEIHVFEQPALFLQAAQDNGAHLAILDGWQLLTFDLLPYFRPHFVAAEKDRIGRRYLLLARQDAGIRTADDLRGKVLLYPTSASAIGGRWLDTVVGLPAGAFFKNATAVPKASAAILPVFFGKADACLVEESGFEVLKELNPQIGQTLQVLAESELFLFAAICVVEEWPRELERNRERALKVLSEIHLNPAGQQMMTLLKVSQLVPFDERHLDSMRRLRAAYERLPRNRASSGEAARPAGDAPPQFRLPPRP